MNSRAQERRIGFTFASQARLSRPTEPEAFRRSSTVHPSRVALIALIALSVTCLACTEGLESGAKRLGLENDPLLEQLSGLAGVTVEEVSNVEGARGYRLTIEQPVDHAHPDRGSFSQRALLLHRDVTKPMVLASTGYGLFGRPPTDSEVSFLLEANSLFLEHRFFEGSVPDPLDYSTLTIRQAAEDHHRVVTLLKGVYRAKWLSTGVSKGGMTSLYHRRFFPKDVDGTIAYVAPQSYGTNDPRYPAFLEEVGSPACRSRLIDFQRAVLSRRDEILPLYEAQAAADGLTYQRVGGLDVALEHSVQEFRFALWQYLDESFCLALPATDASAEVLAATLDLAGPANLASDQLLSTFGPYYYQASAQLGSYGPLEKHLKPLLKYPGSYRVQRYSPAPVDHFDIGAMPLVQAWLALFGERVMLIYGGDDPWSAGALELGHARDSFRYIIPGANHATANSFNMPEPQRSEALATLERWAGAPVIADPGASARVGLAALLEQWALERQPRKLWRRTRP